MKTILQLTAIALIGLLKCFSSANAQVSYQAAGYLNVVDFGATPNNPTDDDQDAINACIDAAIQQELGVFIPAGQYHISEGIKVENDEMGCSQFIVITGSTKDKFNRSRIILKEGSGKHVVVEGIEFGLNGGTCHGNKGWTDTYHRVLKHIDITIETQNDSSVAVRWRGAEGCGIYDVHVDLTQEPTAVGFQNLPGSGGSTHTISVVGGRIALDLYPYGSFYEGAQPTPTVSGGYFEGQTGHAVAGEWRGMMNLVGCHFKMKNDVIVVKDLKRMGAGGYGGSVALVDCIIDYESAEGNNTAFTPIKYKIANGFTLTNSYLKNVDYLSEGHPANNPTGWVYYEEVAYDDPSNYDHGGEQIYQGVFIDKSLQLVDGIWIKNAVNNIVPPSDLSTKHKIPIPFPSFEWDNAVLINDYQSFVVDGDWAPAFNEAINTADIVVIPSGDYMVKSTIHLKPNSVVLGLSHERSQIYSNGSRNFDSSTDPYSDPRPIMDTPDDANATCIISDLALKTGIPIDGEVHKNGGVGGYPLLWRAGRKSVIKHIDTRYFDLNNYRDHYSLSKRNSFGDIKLMQILSPIVEGGIKFKTYNKTGVWNTSAEFPPAFLLETHEGDQRIVARPFDDVFDPLEYNLPYSIPNITLLGDNSTAFDLVSMDIGTADFNTLEDTIFVIGFQGAISIDTIKIVTNDQNPRPNMQTISINWTGIDSVLIISEKAFALDNVDASTGNSNFNALSGTEIEYDVRITQSMFQHLNINPEVHDKVLITGHGGGRWYNHQLHGKQWLNFNNGFIRIQDTKGKEPLHFYHLHAQHGHQRARIYIDNASHVSVYGTKVEIPTSFMRITNSDHIRIFGHGGLTNPIPGHDYYYFENTTNYLLAGLADQTYSFNDYPGSEFNELTKVAILEGNNSSMLDVTNGTSTHPGSRYKPILWRVGTPATGSQQGCSNFRSLTVESGSKSWQYCMGEEVTIIPDSLDCMIFTGWTGYLESDQDTVSFIMPDQDITIKANYNAKTPHIITINNGYGSGLQCEGTKVLIYADPAPVGKKFDRWIGGIEHLTNDTIANTVLIVPNADVELTAQYKEAAAIPVVEITMPQNNALFQFNEEITIKASATISEGNISKLEYYHDNQLIGTSAISPYQVAWKYGPDVVSELKIVAKAYGDNGTEAFSDTVIITVNPALSPYLGAPHQIPGKIEAEHYDWGGIENAYWDSDVENKWDDFRVDEGVDIQQIIDGEANYGIGYIETNEYLKYSVDVDTTGYYSVKFRIASNGGGGQLKLLLNNDDVTGNVSIPSTGGWQNWSDKEVHKLLLQKGKQTLKIDVISAGFNINYLEFVFDSGYVEPVSSINQKLTTSDKINFNVYPTIVQDKLTIKTIADSFENGLEYKLYNLQGSLLMHGKLNRMLEILDVSVLHSGVYIIKIQHHSSQLDEFKLIK